MNERNRWVICFRNVGIREPVNLIANITWNFEILIHTVLKQKLLLSLEDNYLFHGDFIVCI